MGKLNRQERRALKSARRGPTPFAERLIDQQRAIERTTVNVRVDKKPVTVDRYMGLTLWTVKRRITLTRPAVPGAGIRYQRPGSYKR